MTQKEERWEGGGKRDEGKLGHHSLVSKLSIAAGKQQQDSQLGFVPGCFCGKRDALV